MQYFVKYPYWHHIAQIVLTQLRCKNEFVELLFLVSVMLPFINSIQRIVTENIAIKLCQRKNLLFSKYKTYTCFFPFFKLYFFDTQIHTFSLLTALVHLLVDVVFGSFRLGKRQQWSANFGPSGRLYLE